MIYTPWYRGYGGNEMGGWLCEIFLVVKPNG